MGYRALERMGERNGALFGLSSAPLPPAEHFREGSGA